MDYWQGEKIRLRAIEDRDVTFFQTLHDEDAMLVDLIRFPQSPEQLQAWFRKEKQRAIGDKFRFMADDRDAQTVGTIQAFQCDRRHGTFKYALVVAERFRRNGYAAEMIRLLLGYYFLELGYQKVTPHVYAFNAASVQLHERLGFRHEGTLRRMIHTRGKYHDELHFGMTREEYVQHMSSMSHTTEEGAS